MIKLKQVNKYFFKNKKNEIHVLNDITLELESKGLIAIYGASGSGKTTLLNVIGGLDKVQSGTIDFFEHELKSYSSKIWDKIRNEHVGYIFQNYYLLPQLSVYENIRFVLKILGIIDEEYIESRVNYVLNAVGMYKFRKKKALQLSGGQQQRVAIARALVKNPKVIIADEPTGNLDSKNTIEIMNIIKEISKDKLVILVTHEKELVNLYAQRVIRIEDGKIVEDNQGLDSEVHNVAIDDTIYLKDYNIKQTVKNESVNVDLYLEKTENIDIKLIVKNNTLYLDVKSPYKNVKIVDQNNILIKDSHYEKKTKQQLTETTFDVGTIDHSKIKKSNKMVLSLKRTFRMALDKLIKSSKKAMLMYIGFFVAGMIIAYTVATLSSAIILKPEANLVLPKGYVSIEKRDNELNYQTLTALLNEENYLNFNLYSYINFSDYKNESYVGIYGRFDIIEHSKNYKLFKGSYAKDASEIVISKSIADELVDSPDAQEFGIWSYDHLLKESFPYLEGVGKISGIVELDSRVVFADELFILSYYNDFNVFEAYDSSILTAGFKPKNNEIVIHEDSILIKDIENIVFPFFHADTNQTISGTHNLKQKGLILRSKESVEASIYINSDKLYIYSKNPTKLIELLKRNRIEATDIYAEAMAEAKQIRTAKIAATLTSAIVFVVITLVGYYFVIRSSLISRIYEISVYRALGIHKKDIFYSFIVEIVVITTMTSVLGFIAMTFLLSKLQTGLFGMFDLFYVTSMFSLLGIVLVYLLNLLAGLLPIFMLLRKTPSQILSQYDI